MAPVPHMLSLLICSKASDSPADTFEEVQNLEESRRKDLAEGTQPNQAKPREGEVYYGPKISPLCAFGSGRPVPCRRQLAEGSGDSSHERQRRSGLVPTLQHYQVRGRGAETHSSSPTWEMVLRPAGLSDGEETLKRSAAPVREGRRRLL